MPPRSIAGLSLPVLMLAAANLFAASVNLNTATEEELAEILTGIGGSRAAAIVEYREQNGPFKSVDELENVEGIGPHIVELNRDVMNVSQSDAR